MPILKIRKRKPVNGNPQTMATMPARSECHFTKPITKSTTAQSEKKTSGVGRFISPALCSNRHYLWHAQSKLLTEGESNGGFSSSTTKERHSKITVKKREKNLFSAISDRPLHSLLRTRNCTEGEWQTHIFGCGPILPGRMVRHSRSACLRPRASIAGA